MKTIKISKFDEKVLREIAERLLSLEEEYEDFQRNNENKERHSYELGQSLEFILKKLDK